VVAAVHGSQNQEEKSGGIAAWGKGIAPFSILIGTGIFLASGGLLRCGEYDQACQCLRGFENKGVADQFKVAGQKDNAGGLSTRIREN